MEKKFHTKQELGAWQMGGDANGGKIGFKLFFPKGFPTGITKIKVAGDFQNHMGQTDWDFNNGPEMVKKTIPDGIFYSFETPSLPAGFYQYKYMAWFENGESRHLSDPCTRYSGTENQNAAVVIGGSQPGDNPIAGLADRKPLRDLVIYEMNIDDFTADFRECRAPLDAVRDKLGHLVSLGINAILFMPWTAWKDRHFDWGYEPLQFFAVEYRLANDPLKPTEKISWLKKLISACHEKGIHVIMDGVFNHVSEYFPYRDMYQDRDRCPYIGVYDKEFGTLKDLNYNNACTQDFIRDVCLYWIDEFKIDGIRFDNTTNFQIPNDPGHGVERLMAEIHDHVTQNGIHNFSMTIEHLDESAVSVVRGTRATSYWDDAILHACFHHLWEYKLQPTALNALNTNRWMGDFAKVPTTYLSNHDHSHVCWQAGARNNNGGILWYRTQPWAIALFTAPGAPMLQNGQEFAEDHWVPDNDEGSRRRIHSRPLYWRKLEDRFGEKSFWLYRKLIAMRHQYPALRGNYFYPDLWNESQQTFDSDGYGIDVKRQLMIYRREGWKPDGGGYQKFMIVLNFSLEQTEIDVPFPHTGKWRELMEERDVYPNAGFTRVTIGGNWGHVYVDNP
ncbi:MAG: alpha-amylase [Magnetococcales bacterium]|nr:alpha-amylase [Magnetococcales bacterium]MBF0155583.1 alpha-amylase [Magnetococcales bacterium]